MRALKLTQGTRIAYAAIAAFSCSANAQPSALFFRTDYLAGGALDPLTAGMVIADFNNDGKPDFAAGSKFGITVGLGKGDGTFQILPAFTPSSTMTLAPVSADLDGDGNADLILYASNGVSVLPGNGDGTFGTARPVASPSGGYNLDGLQVADLNRDGHPDLVLLATSSNVSFTTGTATATVLLNSGKGAFSPSATLSFPSRMFPPGASPAIGDFNHDGLPDLAMNVEGLFPNFVAPPNTYVTVSLGKGDGSFSTPTVVSTLTSQGANFITAADFNRDGTSDLAISAGATLILLGNGDGSFRAAPNVNLSGAAPFTIAVADWTGSGNPGLGVFALGGIGLMAGNGDGTFYPAGKATLFSGQTGQFAAADLNGDGLPDLIASSGFAPQGTSVSVLLNAGVSPPLFFVTSSAASGVNTVAPASLATIYASFPFIAASAASATPVFALGGLSVNVKDSAGVTRPAPLIYVSPSQINLEIPAGTASGVAAVTILTGGPPVTGSALVRNAVPGIFTTQGNLPAAYAVTYGADNQPQPPVLVAACQGGTCSPVPIPRPAGSRVFLELFATGIRNHNSPVLASVTGALPGPLVLSPAYAGAQGQFEGLDQVNLDITDLPAVQLPPGAPPGSPYAVALNVDGFVSNVVTFAVQ